MGRRKMDLPGDDGYADVVLLHYYKFLVEVQLASTKELVFSVRSGLVALPAKAI